jgi:RNA polymerase sigma factor (sigma-70 family)
MAELLRRHGDTAAALAARVLGSPDLARDAVQEAAIAAMTDLGRLRSPERFGPWFCGIALNVARRWLRQLRPEAAGLSPGLPSADPGPAEAAEAADTAARVRDAIGSLPGGQRQAVRLFYLQGLSHREVASELGISAGAVKARLHQARAALAPRLSALRTPQAPREQQEDTMTAGTGTGAAEWAEVRVAEIRRTRDEAPGTGAREHVMILAECGGDRTLPIWIGPAEATALALALESAETPRPFPYKLAAGLVEAAGSRIGEVRITRLSDAVFYACVIVPGPDGPREVDARPSDAVNLAVACGAPILLNSGLFGAVHPAGSPWELLAATAEIVAEHRERDAAAARGWGALPAPEPGGAAG